MFESVNTSFRKNEREEKRKREREGERKSGKINVKR